MSAKKDNEREERIENDCLKRNSTGPSSIPSRNAAGQEMIQPKHSAPSPKRKMSEMVSEMAAGFLWVGNTIDERQNRLNAACSAWNMACGPPEVRQHQLERYRESYLRFNPATSPIDLANIIKDMEALIERKLKLFPDDKRQIVSAKVVRAGNNFRIEVASARLP